MGTDGRDGGDCTFDFFPGNEFEGTVCGARAFGVGDYGDDIENVDAALEVGVISSEDGCADCDQGARCRRDFGGFQIERLQAEDGLSDV